MRAAVRSGVCIDDGKETAASVHAFHRGHTLKKAGSKAPSGTQETSRLNERLAISVPVAIRGFGRAAAIHEQTTTLDLSQGGASFLSRKAYRPGLTLRLSFPDTQGSSGGGGKVEAEVVRVTDGPAGSGRVIAIRFKDARLANPTLVELLRSKIRASAALLDILQAGTAGTKTEDVIQAICRMVEKAMDSERALLFLRDAPGGPWRARRDWAAGDVYFNALTHFGVYVMLFFGLAMLAVSLAFAFHLVYELVYGTYSAGDWGALLPIVIAGSVGIGLTMLATVTIIRGLKWRGSHFHLAHCAGSDRRPTARRVENVEADRGRL